MVGYVNARDKTEAVAKAIKEYNVPKELQSRLDVLPDLELRGA